MIQNLEAHFNQRLHERLLILLYQKEFHSASIKELNRQIEEDFFTSESLDFGDAPVILAEKIYENSKKLDTIMTDHLSNWKVERVMLIDKIILRIGIYELLYEPSMKTGIIIDRAIRLAKVYGGIPSGKFVNGILGSVFRKYRIHEDCIVTEETKNE
ncbi:MAG: transcription antitermination factor NusB [Caldisericia bacterium]|nr:transcription antitermination factor NusB [Caldisericia bacterium]MDD4614287.1 transcription antitermination factor NusB [Caldisericia bacterium]